MNLKFTVLCMFSIVAICIYYVTSNSDFNTKITEYSSENRFLKRNHKLFEADFLVIQNRLLGDKAAVSQVSSYGLKKSSKLIAHNVSSSESKSRVQYKEARVLTSKSSAILHYNNVAPRSMESTSAGIANGLYREGNYSYKESEPFSDNSIEIHTRALPESNPLDPGKEELPLGNVYILLLMLLPYGIYLIRK